MKKITSILLIPVLAISLALTSCTTKFNDTQNQAQAQVGAANVKVSSYTVQAAEHTLRAAKDSFDLFFSLVQVNHAFVVNEMPDVYAFAQRMQVQAPIAMKQANAVKNVFKYNRNAKNQADLNTAMATILRYMSDVQSNTAKLQNNNP